MNMRCSLMLTRRAFTFLEIMLVVVIIGILLGIVGPRLVGQKRKSQETATRQQMAIVENALSRYEMDVGDFPTESMGLKALLQRPSEVPEEDWEGPYLNDAKGIKDSWGNEFMYKVPSEHGKDYDLLSKGHDRQEGSEDDIVNYSTEEEE